MDAAFIKKINQKIRAQIFWTCVLILFLSFFIPWRLGAFTEFECPELPDGPCTEKGSIETLTYEVETEEETVIKKALVYLPFDYGKTDRTYEVLYFYHGSRDNETTAFSYEEIVNLLDNLICEEKIEPVIVVTPTWKTGNKRTRARSVKTYEAVASELSEKLIPAVEKNYRAISGREGRAIAGVSYGSMITLQSGLLRNYGLFDTYGSFSGAWTGALRLSEKIDEAAAEGNGLRLLYAANGTKDFTVEDHSLVMKCTDLLSSEVEAGENYEFVMFKNGEHDWYLWEAALGDFLISAYGK